ncbi:MAG: phosphate/phosphite/phosphonate ABC transporter substrate-binding protein, partial [Desulfobacula sp.]|uniref:phosphate/phosphite/phosphonate ABC transporter substrate-binding protein n=2 Tax=Desulfobacula sp. TaxID=2593537 RepID=UPI002A0373A7|nr:phosphate/phosphite/phosphonate ABC transporter substrate-binding protein [Desulfobacula sp.]
MYKNRNFFMAMTLFLSFFIMFSVSGSAQAAGCEDPDSITFSIIPTEETIQELTIYKPVIDYLAKMTGKKVEFYMPTSYATVVEAMIGKWVDVAVHGPYSYVLANAKDPDIDVFATYAKKPGHIQEEGPGYKACLITRKGSEFDTIESLKGAVIGLTDPASTSGNLVPRVVFTKTINTTLESYFKKVVYTGGHDLSTMAVYDGKVDAAFVATHRFDNVIERGMVKKEDFNYLWFSPAIPQDPFCYRKSLCPELKKKIAETFLTL